MRRFENLKIDKDGAIIIIANVLMIAFAAWCFFGCVAKKKAIEVSKAEISQKGVERSEAESKISTSTSSEGSEFSAYDFSKFIKKYDLNYDGQNGDGFRFYMNKTENGFEAGAEGKGSANAHGETEQITEQLEKQWQAQFDSLQSNYAKEYAEYANKVTQNAKNKENDKGGIVYQTGVYILAGICLVLLVLLLWLGWRLDKLNKTLKRV